MNKRGAEDERTVLWPYYILVIAIIFISLIVWTNSKVSGEGLNKEFLARDIALLIDTVAISKNDISVEYGLNGKYDIIIKNSENGNSVIIIEEGVETSYNYHYYKEFGAFERPEQLLIEKRNGEVFIEAGKNE